MLKKILSMCLAMMIITVASGASVFAQTNDLNENQAVAKQEKKADTGDLQTLFKTPNNSAGLNISDKSTLADYEKSQKQDKKFSTTTKVLIGVGIAAAVVGVIFVAARRDLKSDVLR